MKHLHVITLLIIFLPKSTAFFPRAARNTKTIQLSSSLRDYDRNGIAGASVDRPFPVHENENPAMNAIALRGGACSDSTPALFGKVASSGAVETFLMYKLLAFGAQLDASKSPATKIIQALLALAVVFGSSYFGQLIDNGMSAATRQVLAPNEIPGDANWYSNLKKPAWNPPGWVFPIMWLIVSKPTQFVAIWKLMTSASKKDLTLPFLVYCAHLSLGDAWNKVFFGLVSDLMCLSLIVSTKLQAI
jgi:tryptophan-rich sensory protein